MEAAKRREARRKKLLESSEDRFKRIEKLKMRSQEVEDDHQDTGTASNQAPVDDPSKSATIASVSQPEEPGASVRQPLDEEYSQIPSAMPPRSCCNASERQSVPSNPDHRGDGSPTNKSETSTVPAEVSPSQNPIPQDISRDSGFVDSALTPQSRTQPCDVNEVQHRSKAVETSAAQDVVSPQTIVFSLLALVTRLWLVSLLQDQSIIVLFFATKVLLFYIGLEQSPVQSGPVRIITALLTFRGASQESVQRVLRCLGFFQGMLRDFSTFIFVFVMVHATMQWSSSPAIDQSESVPGTL